MIFGDFFRLCQLLRLTIMASNKQSAGTSAANKAGGSARNRAGKSAGKGKFKSKDDFADFSFFCCIVMLLLFYELQHPYVHSAILGIY
jgi:hypothetical protein